MKSILVSALIASAITFTACGGQEEKPAQVTAPQGMMVLDLETYGIQATLFVPDSTVAPLEATALASGEVEIIVGSAFQISVAQGGDLVLKKSDLEGDLLYKSTILTETPTSIVYKSELPDGSMAFHHFYALITIDGVQYEAKDIDNGEPQSQAAIEKMMEAVNGLTAKPKPEA